MKSKKELQKVFDQAKGDHPYYSFESFQQDAKDFIKDVKTRSTICKIVPSRSGMSRKFYFNKYNMLLNICYNQKFFWDHVNVQGCGMDMHWHLKYITCQALLTEKETEKYGINSLCGSGKIL